jgi:hypothetical protein
MPYSGEDPSTRGVEEEDGEAFRGKAMMEGGLRRKRRHSESILDPQIRMKNINHKVE